MTIEEKKAVAPLSTGLIEGIGWGFVTDVGIQAITCVTVGFVAVMAPAAAAGVATVGFAAATIGGVVNCIKTVMEKRQEYEEAHTLIKTDGVQHGGRLSEKSQERMH